MLYQADLRQETLQEVVEREAQRAQNEPDRMASWLYAREIVDGISDHQEEIDSLIEKYSTGWSLTRMPKVDLALLRIACWEILFNEEVPTAVAINEAILLAGEFSTEDSSKFINGLLGNIADNESDKV